MVGSLDDAMISQRVNIYRRDSVYLLCPSSKTTAGVWLEHEPGFGPSVGAPHGILGHTLLMALSLSGPTVSHPTDWKTHRLPLLAFTGAKSWRGFYSADISLVSVVLQDVKFQIEPWRNDGKGFEGLDGLLIELLASAAPDELGHAVVSSFQAT